MLVMPPRHYDSTALQTINYAIAKRGYTSYLELGCREDETFRNVVCDHRVGVDDKRGGTLRMTTDEYFSKHSDKFDIIFVDACHKHEFAYRDVRNSLKILNPGGLIVMHDCDPYFPEYEDENGMGNGTVWRAYVHLRMDPNLRCVVGDYDHGIGLVEVAPNPDPLVSLKSMDELRYEDLDSNRGTWLNKLTWEEVKSILGRRTFP